MKVKNPIIPIHAEKVFYNIQHPFVIKTLIKMGMEGMYLIIIKAKYDNPTVIIIFSGEKVKVFPLRSGTRDKNAHSYHFYSTQHWKL